MRCCRRCGNWRVEPQTQTPVSPCGSKLACRVCISTIWGDADGLVCPNVQTVPPSAGYLKTGMPDHPQVTKGLRLLVGLLLRRSSFNPATLRGPALNGHPCPSSALAASMPLDPLRATCVQPAPKSRFVVSGLLRYEDQKPERALRHLGDCSHAPRGNRCNGALRHPGGDACCQALRRSISGLTPLV
ncbi:hypothetical protein SAMN05216605_105234 [Pseudomonas abietaniphila]|uniref:Uncharacterized protein n=1 Tax=Pseudomonas abietaniphila TaxID=89065 RepID=A0A1G8B0Y6_9PSED|nr:hypothetical protein SAMN05216605_105234 [Pseudomonas abietaniphila]